MVAGVVANLRIRDHRDLIALGQIPELIDADPSSDRRETRNRDAGKARDRIGRIGGL
jgi:hypothetical protein